MKLLFVAEQLDCGGAERHLVALASGMVRRGHGVALASLKHGDALGAALDAGGVGPRLCCASRGGLDWQALERLRAFVGRQAPQVLVATSHHALMYAALAAARVAHLAPPPALVFICHSMDVLRRGARARLRFAFYRQFYRCAACIVFVSQAQRRYFAAQGIVPARAQVIHNGIDLAYFDAGGGTHAAHAAAAHAAALRAQFGFGPADLVFGLCAAFREEKRQGDLLGAVARLRARALPARALLVGDGALRQRIEARRAQLGLQASVVLAGLQHDVRPFISLCDAMVLTSHSETFPIATLEYMAMGKSVVASDVGGLREQLADGENGLLYPAGDIDALSAALARLADAGLRARLGRAGLQTVRARFGEQHMLDRYEALFGELAAPGPRAAPGPTDSGGPLMQRAP